MSFRYLLLGVLLLVATPAYAETAGCRADGDEVEDCPKDVESLMEREEACYKISLKPEGPATSARHVQLDRDRRHYGCRDLSCDREKILKQYASDKPVGDAVRAALLTIYGKDVTGQSCD